MSAASSRTPASQAPRVLMLAPEAAPFAGQGPRARAIGALAERLHHSGCDLTLVLRAGDAAAGTAARAAARPAGGAVLEVPLGGRSWRVETTELRAESGLPVVLLGCAELESDPAPSAEFRWGLFCAAALTLAARAEPPFDVLHLHDWETAAAAVFLEVRGRAAAGLERTRTLLTVHDPAGAGLAPPELLTALGLPAGLLHPQLLELDGEVSLLRGGLVFADSLSTPSARQARALRGADGGEFGSLFAERAADLHGVPQGVPEADWDPRVDPRLARGFGAGDLAGRGACKAALQAELGLAESPRTPLLAFVGAPDEVAGFDLLLDALPGLLRRRLQMAIVLAGSAGALAGRARALAAGLPATRARRRPQMALAAADPGLVRRLLAGCDLVLLPARRDPYGDLALRALRYGAVPVAHATGALADFVRPAHGFLFRRATAAALVQCLGRALASYADAGRFGALVEAALAVADPWPRCLRRQRALYRRTAARPERRIELPALPAAAAAPPLEPAATPYIDWGPALPARYGEDALGLMVQSPRHLYLYWEVSPATRAAALGGLRLVLVEDGRARSLQDAIGDLGEYWTAARPQARYRAEIAGPDGRVLIESADVETPADGPGPPAPVRWVDRAGPIDSAAAPEPWAGEVTAGLAGEAEPPAPHGRRPPALIGEAAGDGGGAGREGEEARAGRPAEERAGEGEFPGSSEKRPGRERA